ncbi:segregation and condensation protein A [Pseudochrobactrum asaccharolyticum]|uniref:Segregation and condensation protein A n=1 Tax=Pseudochrobactrum asaccharolyticum TaxID=354351 RepID=A0A366E0X5_9HYPH|nr:ScpA family protein [Pseudochrobactrum asaccharolyticum]RBO95144.1 condensin subunit ScpA [Pseudochrobactrum asaccharolyticum]
MSSDTAKNTGSQAPKADVPMDDLWQAEAALIIPPDSAEDLTLHVDVQGFEGPMDLLLHLARNQKVDLTQISVLALAEQYLKFIELARDRKLELAADYLVMAAWLAYLKSRLLIPKVKDEDGETGEQLASVLQFRLKRLEAMRDAAGKLVNRDRLGRDIFARGMPETVLVEKTSLYSGSLYDLLTAYASQRQRQAVSHVQIAKRTVWSLKEARVLLVRMVGDLQDWVALDAFLLDYIARPEDRASAIASSFAASLELVREGKMQLRQNAAFEPIFVRAADRKANDTASDDSGSETKDEA